LAYLSQTRRIRRGEEMKNLLKFKKAVERSGLNNPLIEKIVTQVGFDKTLIPAYSKQVKADDLYQNNEGFRTFIDSLYEVVVRKVSVKDTEGIIKDLQGLKKDLVSANKALTESRNKFFRNERKALCATDSTDLKILDVYLKVDKETLKNQKQEEREILLKIEHEYRRENGLL
jgi:hypothetical protein